jgi:hypothetical protein
MFDAHNKQEGWDRCDRTEAADPDTRRDTAEAGDGGEDLHPRPPRVICVGLAVFRI